ncbi:unnamed protein product, partial [Ectocarpus fasciculatus]
VAPCGLSQSAARITGAVSAIILSICRCANASPEGYSLASPPSTFEPSAGVEGPGAPEGWTTLTLAFADIGKSHTMAMRDSADESEVVRALIAEGCRQMGATGYHEDLAIAHWEDQIEGRGYNRTGYMFETTGSKNIFQRFLGEMTGVAEERPFFVLESGSWEGASASWATEHLLKHSESLLVCLDTWDGGLEMENAGDDIMVSVEERFHWNMGKAPNGERVVAFKGDSLESLAGLVARGLTASFDVVYVDASHEMKDALGDALLSFRLLKVGGIMIFDDFGMRGVARATAAFEEAFWDSLQVLHKDRSHLVVTKVADDRFTTRDSELVLGDKSRLEALVSRRLMAQTGSATAFAAS